MRLETERLILRPWEDRDRPAYAAIIGDPDVRRFFPRVGTPAEANEAINNAQARLRQYGIGFLAVERKEDGALLGMLGMSPFQLPLRRIIHRCPPVEIGWQLGQQYWGRGYAPEGAAAMLHYAFSTLDIDEVGAVTFHGNFASRRVMEKVGMTYDPLADFRNPSVPPGNWLKPHVLYRIKRPIRPWIPT